MAVGAVLDDLFMRAYAFLVGVVVASAVAIPTKKLKFFLLRILDYVSPRGNMIFSGEPFTVAAAGDMVKCQELRPRFSAAYAFAAKYFLGFGDLFYFPSDAPIFMALSALMVISSTAFVRIMTSDAESFFVGGHNLSIALAGGIR